MTVVLSVEAAAVEDLVPVLVPSGPLGVGGVVLALVQGGHQPLPEVGPGGAGGGHLHPIEAEVGGGEGGEGGESEDKPGHAGAGAEADLVSLSSASHFILGLREQVGQDDIEDKQSVHSLSGTNLINNLGIFVLIYQNIQFFTESLFICYRPRAQGLKRFI